MDIRIKQREKLGSKRRGDLGRFRLNSERLETGHAEMFKAARINGQERIEEWTDIQRKAVITTASSDFESNRSNLFLLDINPWGTLQSVGMNAKLGQEANDRGLEYMDSAPNPNSEALEVKQGIDDQLAGAVPRDLAATVGFDDRAIGWHQQVAGVTV